MSFVKKTFEEIINTDHKVITEESSKSILKKYGIKVPGFALVTSAEDAAKQAKKLKEAKEAAEPDSDEMY